MRDSQREARFNLKAVVQQTGIKPDTLRAWERRYGLPTPERSSGGHRLYTQGDVDTIKWLTARQREGLSIRRAVELWRVLEAEGRDPLEPAVPVLAPSVPIPDSHPVGRTIRELREWWIDACLEYDELGAQQIVNQAFALYSPETVAVELLQRAVAQIGNGWYQGTVTVQQEHFCSGLVIRRLEALVMGTPRPSRAGRILVACPPQEQHVIGPLLLTYLLRRRGWEVVYLGANVPIEQLEIMAAKADPQLVISAAQQLRTAASLMEMAQLLGRYRIPLAYGGLVFNRIPALRQRIAGRFLGEQLEAAPGVVESLMTLSQPLPTAEPAPGPYLQALKHFQQRRSLIDARVLQSFSPDVSAQSHLALANQELSSNISAALALGDMEYLGADIEWVTGLLRNHQLPNGALFEYLDVYHQVAVEQLGDGGKPITDWLAKLVGGPTPVEQE
jgi:DNA-binding transcriptional MerR regulator/methylmalonyl-CoA mutase cobalamin-binding subunit